MTISEAVSPLTPSPSFYPATWTDAAAMGEGLPRVAIVMRTKNRPLLLHRALGSVLLQSYIDWHLYLVNDGGERDRLDELVGNYLPLFDRRLTVIHHPESKGMEAASNAAIRQAAADLVAIHDDDDAWHPDFLAEATAFLSSPGNAGFIAVTTGCTLIRERIERDEVLESDRTLWPHGRGIIDFEKLIIGNQFPPICMVFRHGVLEKIGAFNEGLRVLGDWEFNLRLSLLGDFGFIDRPLAYYHHRAAKTDFSYGNTVVDGLAMHELQNLRLRNGMLRTALAKNPETLGLLVPILRGAHQLDERLARIEAALERNRIPPPLRGMAMIFARLTIGPQFELAKLLCTIGLKSAGTALWNNAAATRQWLLDARNA